jgi:hypothetical protein
VLAEDVPDEPSADGPLLELDLPPAVRLGSVGPDWALSFSPGLNHDPRLYARLEDPGHRHDLADAMPVATEALEQYLLRRRRRLTEQQAQPAPEADPLSPETIQQLEAMGYLGQ